MWFFVHHATEKRKAGSNVQLQQGEVGVAVICLVLALRHDIVLECARRLRVVSVQAIESGLDVLWPFRRKVECGAHGGVSCQQAWVGKKIRVVRVEDSGKRGKPLVQPREHDLQDSILNLSQYRGFLRSVRLCIITATNKRPVIR